MYIPPVVGRSQILIVPVHIEMAKDFMRSDLLPLTLSTARKFLKALPRKKVRNK